MPEIRPACLHARTDGDSDDADTAARHLGGHAADDVGLGRGAFLSVFLELQAAGAVLLANQDYLDGRVGCEAKLDWARRRSRSKLTSRRLLGAYLLDGVHKRVWGRDNG